MSNSQNDNSLWLILLAVVSAAVCGLIWQFSTLLGLDFSTGAAIAFRLFIVCAAACAVWYFDRHEQRIKFGIFISILLALLWSCFWPALNFYEAQQNSRYFHPDADTLWWASWYWKAFTFFAIPSIGILITKVVSSDW